MAWRSIRRALWRASHAIRSHPARGRHLRRPLSWAVLPLLAVLLVAGALHLSEMTQPSAHFSIQAATQELRVDLPCGERIVWDLPAGLIGDPEGHAVEAGQASVTMAGDTSLVLRLSADGHLEANWPVQSALSCRGQAATPDRLQVQADDAPVAVGDELVYRSRHPFNQGSPSLLLPLRGRMLLGGEITEGAGFGSAVNLPILMSARIESRIADRIGQRRLVHAEDIEAGSMVDTHACLSAPAGGVGLSACLRASESEPATGFVRVAAATDESGPMLYAQVSVTGRAVGIRPHAGLERRMMVTRWAGIVTSPWVQILALLVVALGSLCGLLGWTLRDLVQGIAASGGHS